jgi:hypothetical protein
VDRKGSQGEQGAWHGLENGHEPGHPRHVSISCPTVDDHVLIARINHRWTSPKPDEADFIINYDGKYRIPTALARLILMLSVGWISGQQATTPEARLRRADRQRLCRHWRYTRQLAIRKQPRHHTAGKQRYLDPQECLDYRERLPARYDCRVWRNCRFFQRMGKQLGLV